jgi:deazaflavin-dependent oxidoreductase (nitroreductase family)
MVVSGAGPHNGPMSLVQRLGAYRWFARTARALVPVDRFVARATKGRIVALGMAPSLIITTTGRKTGEPRTQPLTYARDGDGFAVIGSNWGQTVHPAWSANLLANPQAVVRVKGRSIPVEAALIRGAERERLWGLLLRSWPAYRVYAERAHRELRIFRLTPRP